MLDQSSIRALLQRVAQREQTIDDAIAQLGVLPVEDLGFARVDHHRSIRCGFPEVIYCQGKTPDQVAQITSSLATKSPLILGTRASADHYSAARALVPELRYDATARVLWRDSESPRDRLDGVVLVAAGTSDMPVAEEAAVTLEVMGQAPRKIYDVGVAGLHRLLAEVPALRAANVIVVIAGMEGALPSVVGGLVTAPVIAVPTSVGYGASFGGLSALLGMLNSCTPGIAVMNIDNGFGAAHLAARINNAVTGGEAVNETLEKLDRLSTVIRGYESVLVAFSGGVDSAVVLAIAQRELPARTLACIGISPSYPQREQRDATATAEKLGAKIRLVPTREQLDPNYIANAGDRCYFCKSELFGALTEIAAAEGWNTVVDGVHLDDRTDHQHGMRAARDHAVRSPLFEAGLNKKDVRALAEHLALPVWDKPAMACLASRVPVGTAVTPELLARIEAAEDALISLDFRQVRVRHHGDIARIELPAEDLARAISNRVAITLGVQHAGYRFATLDLGAFRGTASNEQTVPLTVRQRGGES